MIKQVTRIFTFIICAISLLAVSAQGQNISAPFVYTGMETAEGRFDPGSGIVSGNTFVLDGYGEWENHHLTVSIDYDVNQIIPAPYPVIGGSWTLVVYREGKLAGSLFGDVRSGEVSLVTPLRSTSCEISKHVSVNLVSTGGLGAFEGHGGKNAIEGFLSLIANSQTHETMGNLNLGF